MSGSNDNEHEHKHSGHTHVNDIQDNAYNNLLGLHEQTTLNIKSYRLQYALMFIFLLIVIFLTIRAFSNPYPFFIEYVILVTAILAAVYHIINRFM